MNIATKYRDALRRIPPPGTGCHSALLGTANLGIMAGLSDHQILDDIRGSIPAGHRRVLDKEIHDAIRKARREVAPSTTCTTYRPVHRPTPPRPLIDGEATRRKLITAGEGATAEDILSLSHIPIDPEPSHHHALVVLNLYDGDECLYLGDQYGKTVKPVSEWREIIQSRCVASWPHVIPNPLDGQVHDLGEGKRSFRCDTAVSAFRYAVVEFDTLPKPDQFAFWYSIITKKLLDVAVLLESGGKSIHAWIRVDLPDRNAWNREVGAMFYGDAGVFTVMGADRACRNPSRLSRLPGHYRVEKSNWQRLLYLNPNT
jgi:hypothetical protein